MLNDVQRIIETLSVPAAEYVPAIGEALTLLQELADRAARPSAVPAGMWLAPMEPDEAMFEEALAHGGDFHSQYEAARDDWLWRHPAPQQAVEPTSFVNAADWLEQESIAVYGKCNPHHAEAANWLREAAPAQAVESETAKSESLRDSLRLDWLERHAVGIENSNGWWAVFGDDSGLGKTLREAIDQAAVKP